MIPTARDHSWEVKLIDLEDTAEMPAAHDWTTDEIDVATCAYCDAPIDTIPSPPPVADPCVGDLTVPSPPPVGAVPSFLSLPGFDTPEE